jgi:hypothetical protein
LIEVFDTEESAEDVDMEKSEDDKPPQRDETEIQVEIAEIENLRKNISNFLKNDEEKIVLIITEWKMLRYTLDTLKHVIATKLKSVISQLENLLRIWPSITSFMLLKNRSVIDTMNKLWSFTGDSLPASEANVEQAENIRFLANVFLRGMGVSRV